MNNSDKIILHLCADTGSDTQPYRDAGYDVRCIGSDIGVENYYPPENVYGIIANPPCTMFSRARTTAKTPRDLREGMRLVKECLRIIWECQYAIQSDGQRHPPLRFWAMENPATGSLRWFMGRPAFEYTHAEYGGDMYKKTALWGDFNIPYRPLLSNPLPSGSTSGSAWLKKTAEEKSFCNQEFARAFFLANP